jgi:hypothetical protein
MCPAPCALCLCHCHCHCHCHCTTCTMHLLVPSVLIKMQIPLVARSAGHASPCTIHNLKWVLLHNIVPPKLLRLSTSMCALAVDSVTLGLKPITKGTPPYQSSRPMLLQSSRHAPLLVSHVLLLTSWCWNYRCMVCFEGRYMLTVTKSNHLPASSKQHDLGTIYCEYR